MKQRFHPEGMASLIAAILVTGDVAILDEKLQGAAEPAVIDYRRTQVLELAREHYKVYQIDFDNTNELWRGEAARNATNNLAKLNRANLQASRPKR